MKFHLPAIVLASIILLSGCGSKSPTASNTSTNSPVSSTSNVGQTPASVTSNWYTYTSKDGSYTVLFPNQPKETKELQKTAVGNLNLLLASYTDKQQNIDYLANETKLGAEAPKSSVSRILDGLRNGAVKGSNSILINEKNITLNGYSGREITYRSSNGDLYFRARIFVDTKNSILYGLRVAVNKEADLNSQEATAFLDSLTIKS